MSLPSAFDDREIAVERPVVDVVADRELDALDDALRVVERGQQDRRAELAFVDQVGGDLVIGVDADLEPGQHDLVDPDVEVMVALGLDALSFCVTVGAALVLAKSDDVGRAPTSSNGGGVK